MQTDSTNKGDMCDKCELFSLLPLSSVFLFAFLDHQYPLIHSPVSSTVETSITLLLHEK
jgi:hypothetical protein